MNLLVMQRYLINLTFFDRSGNDNISKDYRSIGYNVRLIRFPDGFAQIRFYEDVLTMSDGNNRYYYYQPIEPFSGKRVREVNDFDNISKTDPLELRNISLARTKRKINEYAHSVLWDYFATFTFDPQKINRADYKLCQKRLCRWLGYLRKMHSPDLKYLIVPELCKDMESWHFHGLFKDIGNLDLIDSGIIKNGIQIYNIRNWHYGFSTISQIKRDDIYAVCHYISKYMTKECHAMTHGTHRYYISHGLPMPEKSIAFVERGEEETLIRNVEKKYHMKTVRIVKSEGNYTGIIYVDLEPILPD